MKLHFSAAFCGRFDMALRGRWPFDLLIVMSAITAVNIFSFG